MPNDTDRDALIHLTYSPNSNQPCISAHSDTWHRCTGRRAHQLHQTYGMGVLAYQRITAGYSANDVTAPALPLHIQMTRQTAGSDHRQLQYTRRLSNQAGDHGTGGALIIDAILLTHAIETQTIVVEAALARIRRNQNVNR